MYIQYAMGVVASMVSSILIEGEIAKHIASSHARIMTHQTASCYYDGLTTYFHKES